MRKKGPLPPHVAEAVLARDGDCRAYAMGFAWDVRCAGRPHIHHRLLRSQGGPDTEENLVVLCDLHHHHAHNVDRAGAEETGIIIRRSTA